MAKIILFDTTYEYKKVKQMDKNGELRAYISKTREKILKRENVTPESVSENILSIWGVTKPPVPIVEICKALGFKIFLQEYDEDELSGFIAIDNEYQEVLGTDKVISLNKNDNEGHKRFTISHELCHYIFDFNPYEMPTYLDSYTTSDTDEPREKNANTFAANLLMPEKVFKKEYEKLKEKGLTLYDAIGELAEIFKVSPRAIQKRFEEIGELQDGGNGK